MILNGLNPHSIDSTNIEINHTLKLAWVIHATLFGTTSNQQSFNKWGLVRLNFAVHKNTGKFECLTKRACSTSFLLISSVKILLSSKKKPEMGDFHFPNFSSFVCKFSLYICLHCVTKYCD